MAGGGEEGRAPQQRSPAGEHGNATDQDPHGRQPKVTSVRRNAATTAAAAATSANRLLGIRHTVKTTIRFFQPPHHLSVCPVADASFKTIYV